MTHTTSPKVVYYKKYGFVAPDPNCSEALKTLLENEGYSRKQI